MTELEKLRQRQAEIAARLVAIHDEAGDEDLTEEQRSEWDTLDAESRSNETAMQPLIEREQRAQRVAESRAKWGTVQTGAPKADPFDVNLRTADDRTLVSRARQILTDDEDGTLHLRDGQKTHVERLLRTNNGDTNGADLARLLVATENEHYRSAFPKLIAGRPDFSPEEVRAIQQVDIAQRAMAIGTPAAGGYAVPVLIDPTIILTAQESPNDIMRLARVERITNDRWKGLTSAGMSWKWDGEAAPSNDNSPTVNSPEVLTKRADGFIPYSIEVEMDWPSFASDMAMLLEEGYSELVASTLTTGAGTGNVPMGIQAAIVAAGGITRQVATSATLAPADIYGLWADLPMKWRRRQSVAWMSSTSVENAIRQFGTTDPNFSVNIKDENINSLFRREYVENDFMAAMPTGVSTAMLTILGDWKQFLIAQRMGMTVERIQMLFDPTNNRPTGQRGMVAYARLGSGLLVPQAFRALINK